MLRSLGVSPTVAVSQGWLRAGETLTPSTWPRPIKVPMDRWASNTGKDKNVRETQTGDPSATGHELASHPGKCQNPMCVQLNATGEAE